MGRTEYTYSEYHGFRRADFTFEGKSAVIVFPDTADEQGRWMLKMEYFDAFPNLELELVRRGWHLCYLENDNRWGTDSDSDRKARFADYMAEEHGLERKFACIGMSCGGLCSVYFAARHPEYVSVLYLDAPVMNFLSCPMGFGVGNRYGGEDVWQEFTSAHPVTLSELLTYRNHPLDKIPEIMKAKLPLALLYGDEDTIVPYEENGILLEEEYRKTDLPFFSVCREGCGHHPHGLEEPTPLADFIENNSKA